MENEGQLDRANVNLRVSATYVSVRSWPLADAAPGRGDVRLEARLDGPARARRLNHSETIQSLNHAR
jgi:hypothetical protein